MKPLVAAVDESIGFRRPDGQSIYLTKGVLNQLAIEAYVHRVGRCGRAGAWSRTVQSNVVTVFAPRVLNWSLDGKCAGRKGVAHSLVTLQDRKLVPELVALLQASQCRVPDELVATFDLTLRRPGQMNLDFECFI